MANTKNLNLTQVRRISLLLAYLKRNPYKTIPKRKICFVLIAKTAVELMNVSRRGMKLVRIAPSKTATINGLIAKVLNESTSASNMETSAMRITIIQAYRLAPSLSLRCTACAVNSLTSRLLFTYYVRYMKQEKDLI